MSELTTVQKDKLLADIKVVMADAEALLAATAQDASAGVNALRNRVQASLATAKTGLIDAQAAATVRARAAAKATDEYVHENPWKSVTIAAGAGLLVGLLLSRR